jgi:hypothetical protein
MRAYRFELASCRSQALHQRLYLLIAVTDAQLISQSGASLVRATLRCGDVDWVSVPRAHTIVNRVVTG